MRRLGCAPMACALLTLTLWQPVSAQTRDVPHLVNRAMRLLLAPDGSGEQCLDGLASLLDAILKAAPAAGLDGSSTAKVAAAREQAAAHRLGDSLSLLGDAYRAVEGKAFVMPATVRSPGDAKDFIRTQLSSVAALLDQDRAGDAVRLMLGAALMIVTPVAR